MERLAFDVEIPYSGLEATVHLARYAVARPLCAGKRVLDVACGEGYGSRLLRDWGASQVEGVDVSQEAVERADRLFAMPGLRYSVLDATHVDQAFADQQFDLIVSIETIEHLPDPAAFLRAIKRLLAPGGHVILTCPNDWWYYPTDAESNPYHLRKYRHDEFMALAQSVLGAPAHAGVGTPVAGFVNVALSALDEPPAGGGQMRMMGSKPIGGSFVVPMERPGGPARENCSYFFAIWGPAAALDCGAAILPVPMDIFRNGMYASPLQAEAAALRSQLQALGTESADLSARLRDAQLRFAAVTVENELMHENVERISAEHARISAEHARVSDELARLSVAHEHTSAELARVQAELGRLYAALDTERGMRMECEAQRRDLAIAAYRYQRLRGLLPTPLVRLMRRMRDWLRGGDRDRGQ